MLTDTPLKVWGPAVRAAHTVDLLCLRCLITSGRRVPPLPPAVPWTSCGIPLSAVLKEKKKTMISLNSRPYPGPPK